MKLYIHGYIFYMYTKIYVSIESWAWDAVHFSCSSINLRESWKQRQGCDVSREHICADALRMQSDAITAAVCSCSYIC